MRLAIFANVVGVALVAAAVWQGLDGRILTAVALAIAALAVAFIRERL